MNETQRTTSNALWKYLAGLILISIPFWVLGEIVKTSNLPINLPVSALMAVNPMIVALVLVRREKGSAAVRDMLKRVFDARRIQRGIWYVPVVLLMPALLVAAYGLMVLTGSDLPKPEVPLLMAPIMFLVFFLAATGEEMGWQGHAYERVNQRWNALMTSILLGIVWAVWHIIPYIQTGNSLNWIVWQCVATVGMRVLIVWLFENTNQSLFAAITFHSMINVSTFLFPNYGSHYDPFFASIAIWTVACAVIVLWGPELSPRNAIRRAGE